MNHVLFNRLALQRLIRRRPFAIIHVVACLVLVTLLAIHIQPVQADIQPVQANGPSRKVKQITEVSGDWIRSLKDVNGTLYFEVQNRRPERSTM